MCPDVKSTQDGARVKGEDEPPFHVSLDGSGADCDTLKQMDHHRDVPVRRLPPVSDHDAPGYCNVAETAAMLGVSRMTIWRWIRSGRLPAARLGHRTVRIDRADVERLLERSRVPATAGPEPDVDRDAPDSWPEKRANRATRAKAASDHVVQFYESDSFLIRAVCDFIRAGMRARETTVIIATPLHHAHIEESLRASGVDISVARAQCQYLAHNAAEMLSRVMVDGKLDTQTGARVLGGVIEEAAQRRYRVRVFDEMGALLAVEGDPENTIRLEQIWGDLVPTHSFSLVCAYPVHLLVGEARATMLLNLCAHHAEIIPAESFTDLTSAAEQLRAIALLQQKAHWLEYEISRRKEAEERLQAALETERIARQAAHAAVRLRDEFIAVAAHELKTPLTPLLGQIQLLTRRLARNHVADPGQIERSLHEIAAQGEKLARRIDQIVGGFQLDAGTLTVDRRSADLVPLVTRVASRASAWSDRHTIQLETPSSLTALVDSFRFEQVVTSLLDNAIRFSPAGGPIEVILARSEPGMAELSVRDHGVGLPIAKRDGLFERFSSAHTDDYLSGIGLGLYLCRRIIEMHGGEIGAEFPVSGGARFVVRLPVDRDQAPSDDRLTPASGT